MHKKALQIAAILTATTFGLVACGEASDPDDGYYDSYYTDDSAGEADFSAPAKRPPENRGTCSASQGCAPLTVHTSGDSDFYLVLRDSNTQRKAATIYIRAGRTYQGGMPSGSYDLYYTAGDTWYGNKLFFGPDASVSKADSTLDFYQTAGGLSGVELTLYGVVGGNLSTSRGNLTDLR